MKDALGRRTFVQVIPALLLGNLPRVVGAKVKMLSIDAGPWSFELPVDWHPVQTEVKVPYFESRDGAKGCYAKAITFPDARPSSREAADYLQSTHQQSYAGNASYKWETKRNNQGETGLVATSAVDIFDQRKRYRILTCVFSTPKVALVLTLHDYDCENYSTSLSYFTPIEQSVRGPKTEASS